MLNNNLAIIRFLPAAIILLSLAGYARGTEPVNITILTLDTRPPNNLLVKQLAAIAGVNLKVEFGGSESIPETGADLVSLNAASAGSLVGSRSADPWNLTPPIVRPDALLHFAVPRVEPTVTQSELITQYAQIRQSLENADTQRLVIDAVRNGTMLNDEYLHAYAVRMRGWVDFLARAKYDPDRLLITLDDNRPGPLSDGLKLIFGEFSNYVYDGTDEGMMLLLARALRERQDRAYIPFTIPMVFTNPSDLVGVRNFESGMTVENILTMCDWLDMRVSPVYEKYDMWRPVLWVHTSGDGTSSVPDAVRNIAAIIGERPVIVADIAKPNGGDPELIDTWGSGVTPPGLKGYLAWNTSSNTLGSAIALWGAIDFAYAHSSDPEGVQAGVETFLWSRLLDDYFYQRLIRSEMTTLIRDAGGDPYRLTDAEAADLAEKITLRLAEFWSESGLEMSIPLRYLNPERDTGIIVELPWNRLFEIALYPTDNRGILPVIRPIE